MMRKTEKKSVQIEYCMLIQIIKKTPKYTGMKGNKNHLAVR